MNWKQASLVGIIGSNLISVIILIRQFNAGDNSCRYTLINLEKFSMDSKLLFLNNAFRSVTILILCYYGVY